MKHFQTQLMAYYEDTQTCNTLNINPEKQKKKKTFSNRTLVKSVLSYIYFRELYTSNIDSEIILKL